LHARSVFVVAVCGLAGCVDGFRGSNIQIDLSPFTPSQAPSNQAPDMAELPTNLHFRLLAIQHQDDRDLEFEIQRFEIHKIIDLTSPCYIDVGGDVRFPGLHVTQYANAMAVATGITDLANPPPGASEADQIDAATAVQRMSDIGLLASDMGIKVVTSASETLYPPIDADCGGTGLPPPMCMDDDSNKRRDTICKQAWKDDPTLFEGTDRVLTSPLNGTTFGFVDGLNPISPAPVGGAQFFVTAAVDAIDEYSIVFNADGDDGPGTLMLTGTPFAATRGVTHVHMESPLRPGTLTAEVAIFADLGEDNVNF
jgi:hypothetical protein